MNWPGSEPASAAAASLALSVTVAVSLSAMVTVAGVASTPTPAVPVLSQRDGDRLVALEQRIVDDAGDVDDRGLGAGGDRDAAGERGVVGAALALPLTV